MNSRERLLAALNHREPDRVPIDLGGTGTSTISVKALEESQILSGHPLREPGHEPDLSDRLSR